MGGCGRSGGGVVDCHGVGVERVGFDSGRRVGGAVVEGEAKVIVDREEEVGVRASVVEHLLGNGPEEESESVTRGRESAGRTGFASRRAGTAYRPGSRCTW